MKAKYLLVVAVFSSLFFLIPALSHAATIGVPPKFIANTGLSNGLVGHWTFDGKDVPNGRANDVSGNSNHGNMSGIATSTFYVPGKIGQGFRFDGVDDYVNVGSPTTLDNIELQSGGYMVISAWIKPTATGYFISKGSSSFDGGWSMRAIISAGFNNIEFARRYSTAGVTVRTTTNTIVPNQWHHVVAVWDGSATASNVLIYINGILVGHSLDTNGTVTKGSDASNSLWIGSMTGSTYFPGLIDDVRIYSRALSATEVTRLYNQTAGSKQNTTPTKQNSSGLVGHWTFDGKDVVNGVARDISGNSNHGNLVSIATSTFYTQGKIGQGFRFDGVDDYVGVTASPVSSWPLTLSTWVKIKSISATSESIVMTDDLSSSSNYYCGATIGYANTSFYLTQGDCIGGSTDSRRTLTSSTVPQIDRWYHVVGVFNGHADMNIYINGVNEIGTLSGTATESLFGTAPMTIGRWDSNLDRFSDMSTDDVRIYSRALSATEVTRLYNQTAGSKQNTTPTKQNSSGLVGHWTFDGKDVVNGVARDISGNSNHGNLVSIATSTFYTQGKIGQGFRFDGVDDEINAGSGTSLDDLNTTGMTVSVWVNLETLQTSTPFVAKSDNGSGGHGWSLGSDNSAGRQSVLQFTVPGFTTSDLIVESPTNTLVTREWAHYVATWDGSKTATNVHLYKNGVELSYTVQTDGGSDTPQSDASRSLKIGRESGVSSSFVNGRMDDVRVYNKVLSVSEIKQLYNQGR